MYKKANNTRNYWNSVISHKKTTNIHLKYYEIKITMCTKVLTVNEKQF